MRQFEDGSIGLTIPNDLEALSDLTSALESACAVAGVPPDVVKQLHVVVDEVVSNVVKYAWPRGGSHEICLNFHVRDEDVVVQIVDDGQPFDLRDHPPPAPLPAGSRPTPGGVGIHLVRQLVDRIDYARRDGYNHLTLIKNFERTSDAPNRP